MASRGFEIGPVARLTLLAILLAPGARAGGITPEDAHKLDPRLLEAARVGGEEALPVWIEFADKGEDGPASFARMLGEARASLTPRTVARRLRARVFPLVDERDLPVHTPYLEELTQRGFAPYGVSRWLNRAAVRVAPARLAELASLRFVRALQPVERARRTPDLPATERSAPVAPAPPARGGSTAVSYGLTEAQLNQVDLPQVHFQGYTGVGILVCILDDGFNFYRRHEALKDVVIQPGRVRDFVGGDYDVQDTTAAPIAFEHGAWTFAVLGGYKPGSYVGAAYGAEFALGRTENDFSEHLVEMVYWGMGAEWADSLGADIISSSLGYSTFDAPDPDYTYADMNGHTTTVSRAAEIAASKGILLVNSAGNEGQTSWQKIVAPADVNGDSLIAVGAVDLNGNYANFSSRGPSSDGRIKPDLVALGVNNPLPDVRAPLNVSGYWNQSGTSFSAPLVAGVAACLWQAKPTAPPSEIIQVMRATASKANSPDNFFGYGIPDAFAAYFLLTTPASIPGSPLCVRCVGPNPLHEGESVTFTLTAGTTGATGGDVRVLDAQGRAVRHLWSGGSAEPIPPIVRWNGQDDSGRTVPPGLYFAILSSARLTSSVRVVFLR